MAKDLQLVWDHNILVIWLHAGLVEDVPVRWYNAMLDTGQGLDLESCW